MMTDEQKKSLIQVPLEYVSEPEEGLSETDAIRKGIASFKSDSEVPVKFDDGDAVLLPADKALKAIQENRASVYSYDQQMKDRDEQLYGDKTLAAGALGAARTVSFGASDVAAQALGQGEYVRGVMEANPKASFAGEALGAAVPVLGQLGEAKLAAKGLTGAAKAVGSIGRAVEKPFAAISKLGKGSETAIGKLLGSGLGASLAAKAVGGATEGAIMGAQMGVTDAMLKGAEDLPEYISAGISGAEGGGLFGGVVGGSIGAIESRSAIKEAGSDFVNAQFKKVQDIKDSILKKEKEASNYLNKDSSAADAIDILDSKFPVYGERPKVSGVEKEGGLQSARSIQESSDMFGVNTYASQIDAEGKIAQKEQDILRSNTDVGEQLREQLHKDSDIVASSISKEVSGVAGDLAKYSDDELGQLAQGTIVKTIQEKVKPFTEAYNTIEERGKGLYIDAEDFTKLFRRAAANSKNIEKYGGNVARNSRVNSLALDIAEQKTITGIWNVQKKIKAELREAAKGGSDAKALEFMDDYITDHWDNFARPWKLADQATQDAARAELKSIRSDLNEINAAYSVYKQEVEQLKDVIKLPDYALKGPTSLYEYLQKPGVITPEGFVKKLQSGDATALRAMEYFPNLDKFAKAAQVDKLISGSKRNAANSGRTFSDGSDFIDIRNFSKKWSEMSKEQKNFLFTPEQQDKIQKGSNWLMQFEYAGHKATPYRYLNESIGQMMSKNSMADGIGNAAGIATAALGGMNPASLAAAVATKFAGQKIAQIGQNYLEARTLAKIKGLTDLNAQQYSKLAGVIGTGRKQEAKINSKIKETINSVFDSFPENRAKIIRGTKPKSEEDKDKTHEQLLKEFNDTRDELEKIRGNEQAYIDMTLDHLKDVSDVVPDVAGQIASKQVEVAQYLLTKLPENPFGESGSPYSKMWKPSDTQIRQFIVSKNAAMNPISVVDDIKTGVVSPTAIEAVQSLYPTIYGKICEAIKEKAFSTKETLTEDQKAVFSTVLQGPFDETYAPSFIASIKAANQNLNNPETQSQLQGGGPSGGVVRQGGTDKSKFASRAATGTERLMTRT